MRNYTSTRLLIVLTLMMPLLGACSEYPKSRDELSRLKLEALHDEYAWANRSSKDSMIWTLSTWERQEYIQTVTFHIDKQP
ncbi:MAG: hypothetical protein HQL50_09030 [Magnetococcales bacterium]|nr:hypothetical protein [Magnetococcales bacterium]